MGGTTELQQGDIVIDAHYDIAPLGKDRGRAGFNPGTGRPFIYTSKATRAYESELAALFRRDRRGEATSPVRLDAWFGVRGKGRNRDIDNYVKALLDAGNGVLWRDDHLVEKLRADLLKHQNEPSLALRVEVL